MENQELTKQEQKQKHWKSIKVDFMKLVPKQYKVELEGIDEDNEYYHPKIKISDEIHMRGQCDLKNKCIYAMSIYCVQKQECYNYVYTIQTSVNDDQIEYVLQNFKKFEPKVKEVFEQIKKINEFSNILGKIKNDLMYQSVFNIVDNNKKKESLKSLFEVTEFIENERFITQ